MFYKWGRRMEAKSPIVSWLSLLGRLLGTHWKYPPQDLTTPVPKCAQRTPKSIFECSQEINSFALWVLDASLRVSRFSQFFWLKIKSWFWTLNSLKYMFLCLFHKAWCILIRKTGLDVSEIVFLVSRSAMFARTFIFAVKIACQLLLNQNYDA